MKNSRLALHNELVEILGNRNVYFQAPSSDKLKYPCIVYSLSDIDDKHANNKTYLRDYVYKVTLIHKDPENNIVDKLMNFKFSTFDKSFTTQGLNHYVFTINYKNEKEII